MGKIVRRGAPVADIFDDAKITLKKALRKKGLWASLAKERLASIVAYIDEICERVAHAESDGIGPDRDLAAADLKADELLSVVTEDIWEAVGSPDQGQDVALSVLFPGGGQYYADESIDSQPDRMALLSELLDDGIHPDLNPHLASRAADKIVREAMALRGALETARRAKVRLELLRRMQSALAATAHAELVRLKRKLLAAGNTERAIHAVIPNRA